MNTFAAVNSLKSEGALKTEVVGQNLKAQLKKGFHFNEKAPNRLSLNKAVIKPATTAPTEMTFALPQDYSGAVASFYICDDAVTFCETQTVTLGTANTVKAAQAEEVKSTQGKINKHGFIEDDLNKALELAKKQNQLVLIDFSARWCPGCVRLETETFDTKEFRTLTQKYVKVKLDVDRFENSALSEKYNVKAIPTLLVINTSQEEIDRLVDYQPLQTQKQFFGAIEKNSTPIAKLLELAQDPKSETRAVLMGRLFAADKFKESLAVMKDMEPTPIELHQARVSLAAADFKKEASTKNEYIKTLKEVLSQENASSRSISWRTRLVGLLDSKEEKKKIEDEGVTLANALLADSKKLKNALAGDAVGEFTGLESLLVAVYKAELAEAANSDGTSGASAWKQAAELASTMKISPHQRGAQLRHLIVMIKAQSYDQALTLANSMLKNSPKDPEIQRRKLRILFEQKKYEEAALLGEECLKNSYARNEFWVAETLAKVYSAMKKNKVALDLINRYLERPDSDWTGVSSTRKTFENLKTALATETKTAL